MKKLIAAEVEKLIAGVSRAAGSYSKAVQTAAVQCISHAIEHGDVTLATKLVAAVRKHDKHILVAFFEINGPFRYQKADSAFEKNKAWKGEFKGDDTPNWEGAKKPAEPKSMFDVDEAFDRFLKTCHGQLKNAKASKNAELLPILEAAQASYNAARLTKQAQEFLAKEKTALEEEKENQNQQTPMGELKAA